MTIRTKDLQRLCAVADKAHLTDDARRAPGQLPLTMLRALRDLVPCDEVSFLAVDPARHTVEDQSLVCDSADPDPEELEHLFWTVWWSSMACSYPQRTGDYTAVRRATDFYTTAEFKASGVQELFRIQSSRYNILLPLAPSHDGIEYRLELWRANGSNFSDREQMLLTLLRPHIVEIELKLRAERAATAGAGTDGPIRPAANGSLSPGSLTSLSAREHQLVGLVAQGLTDAQIAEQLLISIHTVHSHLDRIRDKTGCRRRIELARLRAGAHSVGGNRDP